MICSPPSSENLPFKTNQQPKRTVWFLFDKCQQRAWKKQSLFQLHSGPDGSHSAGGGGSQLAFSDPYPNLCWLHVLARLSSLPTTAMDPGASLSPGLASQLGSVCAVLPSSSPSLPPQPCPIRCLAHRGNGLCNGLREGCNLWAIFIQKYGPLRI